MAKQERILYKKQKIGCLLAILLLLLLRLIIYFHPSSETPVFTKEDSLSVNIHGHSDTIILRPFDPNTADSLTLLHFGLKPYVVRNILNYRAKKGRFRTPEQFGNLYGLSDSAYMAIKPYIVIDTMPFFLQRQEKLMRDSLRRDSIRIVYQMRRDSLLLRRQQQYDSLCKANNYHIKKDTVIELNTADTFTLQYIKGIGSVTANRIVKYREDLGGFYNVEQLREIDNTPLIVWDSIILHFYVDTSLIKKINVQTASIKRLRKHPYINSFDKAKQIYETRREHIYLKGKDDICPQILSDEEYKKLSPYLDFTLPPK